MRDGHPDYGLDAPGVVRNLLLGSAAGLALHLLVSRHVLPEVLVWHLRPGFDIRMSLTGVGLGFAVGFAAPAVAMIWSSFIGKVRRRERLLDAMVWTGAEYVLDVGCGRGLYLIGAARRLRSGRAVGIDLWRSEDLSGNTPDATLANALAERVADRIGIETADMRDLPFRDRTFDRVVSSAAIHNLSDAGDRARAIREIARVLRPGGYALIDDVRHGGQYRAVFLEAGCSTVRRLDSRVGSALWSILTFGTLRPATLLAHKQA